MLISYVSNIHLLNIGGNPSIRSVVAATLRPERFEMTSITIHTPATVSVPLGSKLAAAAFGRVLTWLTAFVQSGIERIDLNDRTTEANRVRLFATEMLSQDPRFAADLYAAADRHERN
jgi:hypothetical protein